MVLYAGIVEDIFGGSAAVVHQSLFPVALLGVQDPAGFWDPLGLAVVSPAAAGLGAEVQHGRLAMIAAMGLTPSIGRFWGYLSMSLGLKSLDVLIGFATLSKEPAVGGVQPGFFAGVVDGNFGGAGRLALVAIIGMILLVGLAGPAGGRWGRWVARLLVPDGRGALAHGRRLQAPAVREPPQLIGLGGVGVEGARSRQLGSELYVGSSRRRACGLAGCPAPPQMGGGRGFSRRLMSPPEGGGGGQGPV